MSPWWENLREKPECQKLTPWEMVGKVRFSLSPCMQLSPALKHTVALTVRDSSHLPQATSLHCCPLHCWPWTTSTPNGGFSTVQSSESGLWKHGPKVFVFNQQCSVHISVHLEHLKGAVPGTWMVLCTYHYHLQNLFILPSWNSELIKHWLPVPPSQLTDSLSPWIWTL